MVVSSLSEYEINATLIEYAYSLSEENFLLPHLLMKMRFFFTANHLVII